MSNTSTNMNCTRNDTKRTLSECKDTLPMREEIHVTEDNNDDSYVNRKNILVSKLSAVQKTSKNFFQRKWQRNTSSRKRSETFPFKVKLPLKNRFSLNLLQNENQNKSVWYTRDHVDIQLLTPQNVRSKANSFPRTKFEEKSPRNNSTNNDFNRNTVLRKLSKDECRFVEQSFIKKRCSMCFLLDCGIENSAFFLQQQAPGTAAIMEKPKRQKIARCMIRYNALNSSRPRTESGQPVIYADRKPRCRSYYEKRTSNSDLIRTISNPDIYRSTLELQSIDGEKEGEQGFNEQEEIYTPYTAVGSSDDVHGLSSQLSVQDILTNFEDKRLSSVPKPLAKPRKSVTLSVTNDSNTKDSEPQEPKVKPKPPPRANTGLNISKELNEKLAQRLSTKDSNKTLEVKPKPRPAVSPKPKRSPEAKPKPKPNPKASSMNSDKEGGGGGQSGLSDSQSSTELNIALTVSGELMQKSEKPVEAHNKMYDENILLTKNVVDTNSTTDTSSDVGRTEGPPNNETNKPKKKQQSTKEKCDVAYAVVILQPEPENSKNELHQLDLNNTTDDNYESVYSQADESISSPVTPTSPNVYLEPVNVVNGTSDDPERVPTATKEKRKRFKNKTAISKSMAMKKNPMTAEELKRRQSLPEFHQQESQRKSVHEYEDIQLGSSLTPTEMAMSPPASDDERWDSDEFDSSTADEEEEEEEEEGVFTEQPIAKLPHLEETKKKLYNIVTEILTTERAYVKRLYLLDQVFHERIQEESKKDSSVIPERAIKEIFPNLSPIFKFHSTILLPELEDRIKQWEKNDKIGDVFKTLGHCLLLYTEYVKNFDSATTTLNHWLKKSPRFASIIQELQKDPKCEHLSLQHHMLEPIQRVPRYKLLLADYLKRLPEDSPDRKESEASLVIISKAAENANNSMKENEKFKKLLDIEDRIIDGMHGESLVTASRVFVKEGELTKLAARSGNRMSRTIMLFNDLLLCSQVTKTGKLNVRHIMDLYGLTIIDDDPELPELSFRIKSKQKVLDLTAQTEEEKSEWVTAIRGCVDDTENKRGSRIKQNMDEEDQSSQPLEVGQQAPLWVKDEFVSMCMLCAAKFGMIHRKHHCRGCGRVVCGKCSNYHAPLAYASNEVKRVCYSCSKKLGIITKDEQPSNVKEKLKDSVRKRESGASSDFHGNIYWKAPGKEYKKEWLFLDQFVLYIQKKRQDVKAHTTLPVPGFDVEAQPQSEEADPAHPFCIKLHKEHKKDLSYYIACDSEALIKQWEQHLRAASQATKYVEE